MGQQRYIHSEKIVRYIRKTLGRKSAATPSRHRPFTTLLRGRYNGKRKIVTFRIVLKRFNECQRQTLCSMHTPRRIKSANLVVPVYGSAT